jgi:2-polyprenyl-3-methyl-5-hydroxy-6-metoxy-1,4-benzoquinol methylase
MLLGREQRFNSEYSLLTRWYISVFGMPVVGLRIRAKNILSLIPKDISYQRILDAGSGTGVISFALARKFPHAKVHGIDLNRYAITMGNQIAEKLGARNIEFSTCSIDNFQVRNAYDLIVCVDILEHIKNDLDTIKALYNLADSNGILVLHVPSLYRRYPIWSKKINFDVPTHVRPGYEPHEIEAKVKETGFSILKMGLTYGFWETMANNLSYMITRANMENKVLYSLFFPLLNLISLLGAGARPKKLGAGIFIIAKKGESNG